MQGLHVFLLLFTQHLLLKFPSNILYKRQNCRFLLGFLLLASSFLSSCVPAIEPTSGSYFLYKLSIKGKTGVSEEELYNLIPSAERPNTRPFNLPILPRVGLLTFGKSLYNDSLQQRKRNKSVAAYELLRNQQTTAATNRKLARLTRKINRLDENIDQKAAWFWRYIGEKPTLIQNEKLKASTEAMQTYLQGRGFRDAEVKYQISSLDANRRVEVSYLVESGEAYKIDSVVYEIADPQLAKILLADSAGRKVKAGDIFDIDLISEERLRLENVAKNNGYHGFSNRYIRHGATRDDGNYELFAKEKRGNLYIGVANPAGQSNHNVYKIEKIYFKGLDLSQSQTTPIDTTVVQGINFITYRKSLPINSLARRIGVRVGDTFSQQALAETQRQLGWLNQFAFTSFQIKVLSDSTLAVDLFSPMLDKYTVSATPGLNNIIYNNNAQNFTGFSLPFVVSVRNSLRRLETIDLSSNVAYEGQPSPINSTVFRGSLTVGGNLAVTYPSIRFPFTSPLKFRWQNPRTTISTGINYSEPFWAKRFNLSAKFNYSWQPSVFRRFFLSLVDISLINTYYNVGAANSAGTQFYNELVAQQNKGNNLKVTFDPQFVSSINASYLFNNQNFADRYGNATYFRIFLESGGTFMNFLPNKSKIGFIERVFPLENKTSGSDSTRAYFQFLKVNVDFRRYLPINAKSGWAYRANIGVINPYGQNRSVPYEKNFFAGGSNSVRAWSPLSLGVGSATPDVTSDGNVIPQAGDILLEGSVEYRRTVGNFFGDIQLATFLDAGNTWKWHSIPTKPNQANFDLNRFYREFALGTGFGIRWDLSYVLLRSDWGIKIFDPSQPLGQRFVLDQLSVGNNSRYGLQWQFGIGYPF